MKRFQSAFAAPSGFVVAINVGSASKAVHNGAVARAAEFQAPIAFGAKTRGSDVRDRAA